MGNKFFQLRIFGHSQRIFPYENGFPIYDILNRVSEYSEFQEFSKNVLSFLWEHNSSSRWKTFATNWKVYQGTIQFISQEKQLISLLS
jgi:hypothetical protein